MSPIHNSQSEGIKKGGLQEAEMMVVEMWIIVIGEYKGRMMWSKGYVRKSGMEIISKGFVDY